MSRINTQQDTDSFSNKLSIISSNMARINSQNKRLQQLLNHQTHLDRLREISDGSAQNWQKLAELAENVQELSVQAKTNREKINNSLNRHTQTLNKTLMVEIQNARSTLASFQLRLKQLKNKERKFLSHELQRQRAVMESRLNQKLQDSFWLLEKGQKQFDQQTVQNLKDVISQAKEELSNKYIQCRISLGHLHNIVAFYHYNRSNECLLDQRPKDISKTAINVVNNKLAGIEFNLKRIKGEVEWMKARSKKNRPTSKHQRKITQNYEPMQEMRNQQIGMSVEEVEYELKGMERILGYQSIVKKAQTQNEQIDGLNEAKSRVKILKEQQLYYSHFYKSKT